MGDKKYFVHAGGPVGVAYKTSVGFIAIDKNYFDSNGGIARIFKSKEEKSSLYGSSTLVTIMYPSDEQEFLKNTFDVVLLKSDADFGKRDIDYVQPTEDVYSNFSNGYYIYGEEHILSPIISKDYIYTPLGFVKDKGRYKLLVYKSKEVWTLDDKSQTEKIFEAPNIEGLTKKLPDQIATTQDVSPSPQLTEILIKETPNQEEKPTQDVSPSPQLTEHPKLSLWSRFWNFLKRLVGF